MAIYGAMKGTQNGRIKQNFGHCFPFTFGCQKQNELKDQKRNMMNVFDMDSECMKNGDS